MDHILNSAEDSRRTFADFKLASPLQKAILNLGFEFCTPIQAQSLVHTLAGHDVTGRAQTGTGKTIAFLLTILYDLLRLFNSSTPKIGPFLFLFLSISSFEKPSSTA